MRFLILGVTGMAGHMLAIYLREQGHYVAGTHRSSGCLVDYLSELGVETISLDVRDDDALASVIRESESDAVVNCIGLLNKDCDSLPDLAIYLNSYLPYRLLGLCEQCDKRLIHISTDCVFAGNGGPYSEDSFPDGRSLYDRSKALGEISRKGHLTLRQSIIGPDPDPKGIGLLNWFMQQTDFVNGWTKAIWTGLTTLELAKAVEKCAFERVDGLVNMVPDCPGISKYDLLLLFSKYICASAIDVRAVDGLRLDKSLVRRNRVSSYIPKGYSQQIVELSSWIKSHIELYPHYNIEAY